MQRGVVTPHSKSCPLYSNFQEVYCIRVFFLLIKLLTEISIIAIWWTITRKRWELQNVRPMFIWMVCKWARIRLVPYAEMLHHHYRATKHRFIYVLDCLLNYFNLRPKLWYYAIKFLQTSIVFITDRYLIFRPASY